MTHGVIHIEGNWKMRCRPSNGVSRLCVLVLGCAQITTTFACKYISLARVLIFLSIIRQQRAAAQQFAQHHKCKYPNKLMQDYHQTKANTSWICARRVSRRVDLQKVTLHSQKSTYCRRMSATVFGIKSNQVIIRCETQTFSPSCFVSEFV